MECQHEVAHRVFLGTVERESRASLPSCYGAHELLPESLGGRCKLIELGTAEGRVSDSYRGGPAIAEMIAAAHVSGDGNVSDDTIFGIVDTKYVPELHKLRSKLLNLAFRV